MSVVAELSVTPMVEGEMRPYVDAAVDEVKRSGLKYEVDAMGTTIEGEFDQVIDAAKRAHQAVRRKGVHRVITELRIDDKEDGATMSEELEGYR
ncbi:MAG: MTH1187 family thiamine-binding protein [Armatimonadetes bacterium]|nr:MTH1187 family thiamine-binding protein [Armatimonadota bacterium]